MPRPTRCLLPLLAVLLACGDGSAEETTPPPPEETTGQESALGDAGEGDDALMADPCAEGDGTPCADEQGVDSEGGEITEAGEEGEGAEGDPAEGDAEARGGEEPQMSWRNMVGAGRVVFDRVCGVCHPEGEEDLGPDIRNRRVPVARMRHIIRNGTGEMRPIPQRKLPDRYMDELMAYLTTLGTVRGVRRPE